MKTISGHPPIRIESVPDCTFYLIHQNKTRCDIFPKFPNFAQMFLLMKQKFILKNNSCCKLSTALFQYAQKRFYQTLLDSLMSSAMTILDSLKRVHCVWSTTARGRQIGGYRQVSNIRCTLVANKIVDHSDAVGASPVGAAPTTSLFST